MYIFIAVFFLGILLTGLIEARTTGQGERVKVKGKGPYFTRVVRDSTTTLTNLWPSVHTSYPPSSINAPFWGYSKLQVHRTEES